MHYRWLRHLCYYWLLTSALHSKPGQSAPRSIKGVGIAGATGALAPAMLKPRGWKYLFAPAIICQVYQLVDRQTSKSLYSFKTLMRSLFVYRLSIFVKMDYINNLNK